MPPFHFVLSSQHRSFVRISSPSQHQNNVNTIVTSSPIHIALIHHTCNATQHTILQYKLILNTQQQEQSRLPFQKKFMMIKWLGQICLNYEATFEPTNSLVLVSFGSDQFLEEYCLITH
jgi:hypothetical protein